MISVNQRLLQQGELTRQQPSARIPIPMLVKVTALMFSGLFVFAASLVLIALSGSPSVDPFAAYGEILPGQPRANAEEYGFECIVVDGQNYGQCLLRPTSGIFSQITLVVADDVILNTGFVPRAGMLRLGEVALLLGVPQRAPGTSHASSEGVDYRYTVTYFGQFDYQIAVRHISFW